MYVGMSVARYVFRASFSAGRNGHTLMGILWQKRMWKLAEDIGDKEGRLDICVAAAGVWPGDIPALEYADADFQSVSCLLDVPMRTLSQ